MASRDIRATHVFYSEAMGFDLVKVEFMRTPDDGWAKHFFYDTGEGQLMAFWELHDDSLPQDFPTGFSTAVGLPQWVNHIAFAAADLPGIEKAKQRWLDSGYPVLEIDHDWCYSVYTTDPGGTLVEFCVTTGTFTDEDRQLALRALTEDDLDFAKRPEIHFHRSAGTPLHERENAAAD
jgi:catechol 2,3-dioxygenase-like lactoylglutathione lyase family enzyme